MYHLAQVNIARLRAPIDSPELAEFVHFLEPVNALAEQSPGFVWRLKDEVNDNATQLATPFDDPDIIVNMSVWESIAALQQFAYHTAHSYFVRHGHRRWFHKMDQPHMALWWIPIGHKPTQEEAKEKLDLLAELGPTAEAFDFRKPF